MRLHPGKSELFTPALYHSSGGAEVLGTAIGSLPYRSKFLTTKVSHWADFIALLRDLPLQSRQLLFRFCVYTKIVHLTRTLQSSEPAMLAIWKRADSYADAELQSYLGSPVAGLVEFKRLTALPLNVGGFGIPQFQTIVSTTYTSARAASLHHLAWLKLLTPSTSAPPDQRALLRAMYSGLVAALREDLPATYRSTLDDHCNSSSYAFLLVCPTSSDLILSDKEFQLGVQVRAFNAGRSGRCSCNSSAAAPGHDLSCVLAASARTKKHEFVKGRLQQGFLASGSLVQVEPRADWQATGDDSSKGPRRADLKITGGAAMGNSATYVDVSIASCYHTTRIQSSAASLESRHQEKHLSYDPLFDNFYPFVLSPTGTYHPRTKPFFQALTASGVDVVALKRSIAFGLLRLRAYAYNAMYDGVKVARGDVDYSLSPPPRSSARTACARAQAVFGPDPPVSSARPMDIG
jgi:hypothetical protein